MECVFCKIANHEMPTQVQYEDEDVIAFNDIHPIAPTHILIIPKKHTTEFYEIEDQQILNKLKDVAKQLIDKEGLMGKGYRVELNGGGAQLVNHLHLHLMGPIAKPNI